MKKLLMGNEAAAIAAIYAGARQNIYAQNVYPKKLPISIHTLGDI